MFESLRQTKAIGWTLTLILLAVSFQVLVTPELGNTAIRIGASDVLLPLLGLSAVCLWSRSGFVIWEWRVPHFWMWLAVLSFWMGVSLVIGRLDYGEWVTWALVNKGLGWGVLVAYLLLGGWVSVTLPPAVLGYFFKSLHLFAWVVCAVQLLLYALFVNGVVPAAAVPNYPRFAGFFANPNAFGIAMAAVVALYLPELERRLLFPRWAGYVGSGLTLAAMVISGSRSAWLGFALAVVGLLIIRAVRLSTLIRLGIVAALFVAACFTDLRPQAVEPGEAPQAPQPSIEHYALRGTMTTDEGLKQRVTSASTAIEMWLERPIAGWGLGAYYVRNRETGETAATIHNTFLWLLAETGLVGALLFCGFGIVVVRALMGMRREPDAAQLATGTLGVVLVLAGASIGTEVMYQRYIWFLLGLAVAVPRPRDG